MTPWHETQAQGVDLTLSDQDFFNRYARQQDTLYSKKPKQHSDRFGKRFSIGVNMLGWTLTVPNLMVEFDLNKTKLNNRSLVLNVRYNPKMTNHTVTPRFVFDDTGVSFQFRKYWRTGKKDNEGYNAQYQKLNLERPDTLYRNVIIKDDLGRSKTIRQAYFTPEDSVKAMNYTGDASRSVLYNRYHNLRRTLSGRMIRNARNWRAYYLGAYASFDKYDWCYGKKGEKGQLISIGATAGWSVPLLASAYPHQGGLDLDLGLNVGLPIAKYDGYRYADRTYADGAWSKQAAHYEPVPSRNSNGWAITPKYILQDIHVSLIYRFRSVASKVDLDLVGQYDMKEIQKFRDKAFAASSRQDSMKRAYEAYLDSVARRQAVIDDSTNWANYQIQRRLEAKLRINPDTTQLTPEELEQYKRIILKLDPKATKQTRKAKKAARKQAKQTQKEREGLSSNVNNAIQEKR